jgi:hypothetical protein
MSIELQYKWDKEEFLKASYADQRYRARTVASRSFGIALIFLVASALLFIFDRGFEETVYFTILALAFSFFWFVPSWPLQRLILTRQFSKHAARDTDVRWTIDERGFSGSGSNTHGGFSWDAIRGDGNAGIGQAT